MCTTCGCAEPAGEHEEGVQAPAHEHGYRHVHADGSSHSHAHGEAVHDHAEAAQRRSLQVGQDILSRNNAYARANRKHLAAHGIFALNLVSSPGAGKTRLLVKTIAALQGGLPLAVIEGDQETSRDAELIKAAGAPAIQINTGKGCHLDAHQVGQAIEQLPLPDGSVLMIENVGNLVCPAAFDLGEAHKVVILSVTEGEDKPLKYPGMFAAASLMLLNKCDLLPYLDFDVDQALANARRVNPTIEVILTSATRGDGLAEWLAWIRRGAQAAKAAGTHPE